MKTLQRILILAGVLIVAIIAVSACTFTTQENKYAVVKRFGKIESVKTEAGLSIKAPMIDTVSYIPKALQFYDLSKSEVITSDKKTMIVDAYIVWKVTDPVVFTQSLNASTSTAEGRIDVITYNAIKTTISSMTQEELIVSRDDAIDVSNSDAGNEDIENNDYEEAEAEEKVEVIAISERLLTAIGSQCDQYGLAIEDIQIKVLDLPDENKEAVYERMITERNNIAATYTAQGNSEAQIIKNKTDAEVAVMLSEAKTTAEITKAEGEAEYMRILADAYNDDDKADFYTYSLSLDTAKASLTNGQTTLFLDKDNPIAQIFQGIPASVVEE